MRRRGSATLVMGALLAASLTGCGKAERLWDCEVRPFKQDVTTAPQAAAATALLHDAAGQWTAGAVVALGKGPTRTFLGAAGHTDWSAAVPVNADNTQFDLASLTKVVAATSAAMVLYDDGKLDLEATVDSYWEAAKETALAGITIRQLLTHTSGLPLQQIVADGSGAALEALLKIQPNPPGTVLYTNLNMVVLWEVLRQISGKSPEDIVRAEVWQPLGMCNTGFNPDLECADCAKAVASIEAGKPSDPTATSFGGITGCAGAFSTGADLARFAAMMAEGGTLGNTTVFKAETVKLFTTLQPNADTRALGWDTAGNGAPAPITAESFGHTGWSGTSMLIDPVSKAWAVVLTNYQLVKPDGTSSNDGALNTLRRAAFAAAAA